MRYAAKGFKYNNEGNEDKELLKKVRNEYNLTTHLKESEYVVRSVDLIQCKRTIFILMELCYSNLEEFLSLIDP